MSRRTRVVRERNERGFLHFLQTLTSVLRLFANQDGLSFTVEETVESRHRLVDAAGTLLMLENDFIRGDTNPTGLPTQAIQTPIQNLRHSVMRINNLLSAEIESSESIDFYDEINTAYSTPLKSNQRRGQGESHMTFQKNKLSTYVSLFSWTKIAAILQVSLSTLQRRRKEFGFSDKFEKYSDISVDELDRIYATITGNSQDGLLTPNIGRRRFIGALRSRGLRIQRARVIECLLRVDPVGTTLRWRMAIHHIMYFVATPNSLWHIDSGHTFIIYKLITHVCID
jgi:hypothetical protein